MHNSMSFLFGLSLVESLLLFLVFGVCLYLIAALSLKLMARSARADVYSVPVGAFIGTIATSWALSLGFVAADVWALNGQADRTVSSERSAIHRLIGNAEPDVLDVPALQQAILDYRQAVIDAEWRKEHSLKPSVAVEAQLQKIRSIIMEIARSDAPAPIVNQTVGIFNDLQEARDMRLAIANTIIDQYKWYLLLTLTILTAIAIASAHADRTRAGRKALVLYVLTATISLWILVIHGNPFTGVEQIRPSALSVHSVNAPPSSS